MHSHNLTGCPPLAGALGVSGPMPEQAYSTRLSMRSSEPGHGFRPLFPYTVTQYRATTITIFRRRTNTRLISAS
jgi:hypothetical protein